MKKTGLLLLTLVLALGTAFAGPVDVNSAKSLGQKFLQTRFEMTRGADLQLYYTVSSDNGDPCAYVFNNGTEGFVIVAAADNVRPILGYSNNGAFDATNPYNGAMYMLETYKNSISYAIEKRIAATPEIASEWEMLRTYGRLSNRKEGVVGPLVQTKWNQNSPYNLYSPPTQGGHSGSGGRCYAGCVATAMGQLMKFWNAPIQGEGSHGYNCIGYAPTYYNYGYQYANFGETTYQWDLMPLSLSNASQEEIEAVATLLYHCGVATDMTFDWDGSGTYSDIVPGSMASYFDYDYCVKRNRSSYSLPNWINLLKTEFDLGRPVYYSGQSSEGGHAFVCDGYDENDMMHFNFGWSGSDDDFYVVDAIDYSSNAAAIFNFVPSFVYNGTAQAPTNVTAVKASDIAQSATISWTNPTKFLNNQNLTTIDQIVVTRDGIEIYSVDNATPGAAMSFVDDNVPCYSTFEYRVYAMIGDVRGAAGVATESFGPTCQWKAVVTATAMQGWKGGYVYAYDGAGRKITSFTMTSNNPQTINLDLTLGRVRFAWREGTEAVSLSIKLKNAQNEEVYYFTGNSSEIPEGFFYEGNNGCDGSAQCSLPGELFATEVEGKVTLSWEAASNPGYGYNIYRDGYLFELAQTNSFVDEYADLGGHCYQVCVLCDGGESLLSNEACATSGEGCETGSNLWYELQASGKPIISWEAPENSANAQGGYYVYRKVNDGEYERVKLLNFTKTEYKETKAMEEGNWYYYKVIPYYQAIDCFSAPIKSKYNNEHFVKVYFSLDGVNENASDVNLYPNPTKDSFTIEAVDIQNVMVFNTVGQMVYNQTCEGNRAVINLGNVEAGLYMVKVVTSSGESIQKVSVIR